MLELLVTSVIIIPLSPPLCTHPRERCGCCLGSTYRKSAEPSLSFKNGTQVHGVCKGGFPTQPSSRTFSCYDMIGISHLFIPLAFGINNSAPENFSASLLLRVPQRRGPCVVGMGTGEACIEARGISGDRSLRRMLYFCTV